MQEQPDAQLLRAYVQGDEAAFREIVSRHADLIYSAALRQVNSPALAQDIAQSVFVDLVRKSGEVCARLTKDASLAGWLYRGTRFAVLNHLRDEHRRAEHERQAMQQLITNSSNTADWERIRPILDEAMAELSDHDRDALLLRFFKNQDFQSVGRALGLSDDAAQKRVSRAVERWRKFFAKRGVVVGAGGLAVLISANAVQAAPLALPASISAAALIGTTVQTSSTITATKVIAMTTMQKSLVTATVTILLGAGIYQARQSSQLREQNQTLQQQLHSPSTSEIQQLRQKNADLFSQLAALGEENQNLKTNMTELLKLRAEVARLRENSKSHAQTGVTRESEQSGSVAKSWTAKTELIKNYMHENPTEEIPECQFLSDRDWLSSIDPSASYWPLATEKDYRTAMEVMRQQAEMAFHGLLNSALMKFSSDNHQVFPADFSQLQPYLNPAASDVLTQIYEMVPASEIPNSNLPNSGQLAANIVIQRKTPANKYGGKMVVLAWKQGSSFFYQICFSP